MSRRLRIALWNGSGLDNLGDRLIDHVVRRELGRRIPGAIFQTFTPWPAPPLPLVRIDNEGHWEGEGRFDAIVIGGGALLMGPPFVHPSLQTCYLGPHPDRFRDRCPTIWNAICSDVQFVAMLAEPWRAYVRASSRRLSHRSVRNPRTADLLRSCGVEDPVEIVPDSVVLLRPPRARRGHSAVRRRIGLAVGASASSERFIAELRAPAEGWDSNREVSVAFPNAQLSADAAASPARRSAFVGHVRAATERLRAADQVEICGFGSIYGDGQICVALSRALGCPVISSHDPFGRDMLQWIDSLDCLIASRLHACILAVVAGTPLVAVDPYFSPVLGTSKVREFMECAGLLDAYISLDVLLAEGASLDDLVNRAIAAAGRLPAVHAKLADAARAHFDRIGGIILERE